MKTKLTGTPPEITNIEDVSPNPELMKNFTPPQVDNIYSLYPVAKDSRPLVSDIVIYTKVAEKLCNKCPVE